MVVIRFIKEWLLHRHDSIIIVSPYLNIIQHIVPYEEIID